MFAGDVAALGLPAAQGLVFTETFYWDMNDQTRAWTKRWHQERGASSKWPTMNHAGVYAGTLHYLKARLALGGSPDGKTIVAKMKELPTDDPLFGKRTIRVDRRQSIADRDGVRDDYHAGHAFAVAFRARRIGCPGPLMFHQLLASAPR